MRQEYSSRVLFQCVACWCDSTTRKLVDWLLSHLQSIISFAAHGVMAADKRPGRVNPAARARLSRKRDTMILLHRT